MEWRWRCGWSGGCKRKATHVRLNDLDNPPTGNCYVVCDRHAANVRTFGAKFAARVVPLVSIPPHSELHCSLEAAFHVLVHGLWTAEEMAQQNRDAAWRNAVRAGRDKQHADWNSDAIAITTAGAA